jgi:hypothetical protein
VLESKSHLYNKIKSLELEVRTLKSVNKIMKYQLDRAMNDIWRKDMRIKEMENERTDKDK